MKNNLKLLFVSLGCDKNLVDTEFMLGMLRDDGIEMTDDEQEADIIIVNTCCFINDAKEESINTILEMAELKKEARLKSLIVTGCLAQRYKEEIVKEIPEVDAILGTNSYEDIVNAVHQSLEGKHYENFKTLEGLPDTAHQTFCDNRRTFCLFKDRRGMQQALHILHYSVYPRKLPQCSDGRSDRTGKRTGCCRSKRTHPGGTGDHTLRS